MIGYGDEDNNFVAELTYNYGNILSPFKHFELTLKRYKIKI